MNEIFAYRLKNARTMRGYTLQTLADQLGVSKQMISKYESGKSMPDSPNLIKLAKILGEKVDYFFRSSEFNLQNLKFRKQASLSKTEVNAMIAKILKQTENYLCIEDILNLKSEFDNPMKDLNIHSFTDAEDAANALRKLWNLGIDPIHNIITLLETNEIKVIEVEPQNQKFDGVSAFIDNKFPIIAINKNFPIERKRFTLLHELGHLLLNIGEQFDDKAHENLCNRFAGAMLLPSEIIFEEFGRQRSKISLTELMNFQKQFGISISAIIYRLSDLDVISDSKKKEFFIALNFNPNLKESVNRPRFSGDETSERFNRLVYKALSQEVISISKASALLDNSVEEVRANFATV